MTGGLIEGLEHRNVTVDKVEQGLEIVSILRPDWYSITTKVFDTGITNKMYGYIDETCKDKNDMILVRMYGKNTEFIINRTKELETHIKLSKAGFAAPVYCTINNGYIYGFLAGGTLTIESVRDPKVATLIARSLAQLHAKVPVDEDAQPVFYPRLNEWLRQIPDYFTTDKLKCLNGVVEGKAGLVREINALHGKITANEDLLIGFCHNDLLLENIIHNTDKATVSFIDYEYGSCNHLAFDIGNHFAEYSGMTNVDFNLYPDESYQRWWLKFYLEEYHKCKDLGAVTEEHITVLYKQANFFSLCAHIWWGIWALIQSINSEIDFDYADYSRMKLEEYFKQKEKFFDLL